MVPGDIISINFENGSSEDIKIGVTGSYYIDTGVNIESVKLLNNSKSNNFYNHSHLF